jgi:hypothetical protein
MPRDDKGGSGGRFAPPEAGQRQLTIAVDFDGVIAEYNGWRGSDFLGTPRADVVEVLRILRRAGWKIVIHTTRSEGDIADYVMMHKVPYDEINRNSSYQNGGVKPVATIYWDDRALRYSGNAFEDLKAIRTFVTWNGRGVI